MLSFVAEGMIEFKKLNILLTSLKLNHYFIYSMLKPNNKLLTHKIAPEPSVKDLRISLTFQHLLSNPLLPPTKKPRLQNS